MHKILLLVSSCLAAGTLTTYSQSNPTAPGKLAFRNSGAQEFAFDTGVLRGTLRAGGKSKGLSSVVHIPTGMTLDRSMGLFGHYRVFTASHRYGTAAWDWPSEATLGADGGVTVRWPAAAERPFELRAVYRWSAPNVLDLETVVEAQTNLTRFESFLGSYFAGAFTNSAGYAQGPGNDSQARFCFAEARYGAWLAFPRDDLAASVIRDGRWQVPPSPVDWVIMPRFSAPLGFRRCPANGLTAVVMARQADCFAVSTPEQTEQHKSLYLSLFGRDLAQGETARAAARLVIATGLTDDELIRDYQQWAKP